MLSKEEQEQLERELMNGEFVLQLDELTRPPTARPQTSNNKTPRSDAYRQISATPADNDQLIIPTQRSLMTAMDEFIQDIDLILAPPRPNTAKIKKTTDPEIFSCQHTIANGFAGTGFFTQSKFCNTLKETIRKSYRVEMTITKSNDRSVMEKTIYLIGFKSKDQGKNEEALQSFKTFFATLSTKMVDDQAGFWIKYSDCARIVQAYSDQNEHLHILCENESTKYLLISYFNKDISSVFPNLCTTEAVLDEIIKQKFLSLDVSLPSTSDLTTTNSSYLAQDILKIENQMKSQPILMVLEQRRIRLFGLIDLVKSVEKKIEDIKTKYASNTVKLNLEPQQVKYLLDICSDDLKALETTYMGAKIIVTLSDCEFTAPSYIHDSVKRDIMALATFCTPVCHEIREEAFRAIAHDECSNLINIGRKYKCHIEIQENIECINCDIPQAATQDHVSNKLTAAAINICKDDLADQKVDLVVISSTSALLCDDILEKAGPSVKQEHTEAARTSPSEPFETNGGQLQCRKLLFLSWELDRTSQQEFCQSIRNFVSKAIQHAIKAHHTSVAFPSIGCGKLNIDKNIIANEMLVEAQKQLLTANVLLQIIFVILPEQIDVFEAFQTKLKSLRKGNVEIKDTQVSYNLTTLTLTIISSNTKKQEECKKALDEYVQKSVLVREHPKQEVLKRWTQPAINGFYRFCVGRHVMVDMNINLCYLKLSGTEKSVTDAENEYYREQAEQSEQARLAAIARNIIWVYKINHNSWEKYSVELNARIEDAYQSKEPTFHYTDRKSEEYIIDFKSMTESCIRNPRQRQINRHTEIDVPQHWDPQLDNVEQFSLQSDSAEFTALRALFDTTMVTHYTNIVRIERIQNKPWYMQYNSYKSFSPKKDTEKQLFHGCPQKSAKLIIHSFFNRSFAGINGTFYGQGAYFSANAHYSHSYAKPTHHGERCMFVANVLVGASARGDTNMKTPPADCDSTTDGNHIFVTYRDDQAYAAYLIVYK